MRATEEDVTLGALQEGFRKVCLQIFLTKALIPQHVQI